MKPIKKMGAIFLCACMSLSLLTGCSGESNQPQSQTSSAPAAKVTLNWYVWSTLDIPKQLSEAVFTSFPELRDRYEIKGQLFSSDVALAQKIRLMRASGEAMPDICMFNYSLLPEFARNGSFENLSSVLAPYKSKMTVGAFNLCTYQNKQYAFPYQIKPKVWLYRTDMFADAGIDPTKIKTTDDFIAAGKKLQEKYPKSYMWHVFSGSPGLSILNMVMSGNGSAFSDSKGNYIVDKDPGVRKAFSDIKKVYDSGIMLDINDSTPDYQQAFANGRFASDLTGSWVKNNIVQYAPALTGKWAEAQWPEIGGAVGGSDGGGSLWVVPTKATNKKASIEFLKKLTLTDEGAIGSFKARNIYPSLLSAEKNPVVTAPNKYIGASLPVAEASAVKKFKVFNFGPKYSNEITIVNQYFSKYLQGKATLDNALKSANQDLTSQLGNALK